MARIALIETYPYEAVWGGDAVYLDAIRSFLISCDHLVDTYVTDMTRGRSNPAIRLQSGATLNHRWHMRNALPLGLDSFISLDPHMVGKAVRRVSGRRAAKDDRVSHEELGWVIRELERSQPDLIILAFGACAFARPLAATGANVIALKGFFSDRQIRLGEAMPTPLIATDLLNSLAHARLVGFNNRFDLELYRRSSGRSNGALVGIALPARIQPRSNERPTLLYVAARTTPNIESLGWLLDQVWPLVRSAAPEAELRVAGSVGASFAARAFPQVEFIGFVESLADEYQKCWAVVAPFVSGSSGIKTKIAEALSFGRPVVTTSIGVDPGEPHQYGSAVAVTDDPGKFAATLVEIICDEKHRLARHVSAADQFARHFEAKAAYGPLLDLLAVPDKRRIATS